MILRPAFQHWRHVFSQQDAGEFWQHLLTVSHPVAFEGLWEARNPDATGRVDQGTLDSPLILQPGPTLQSAVEAWHCQTATHGIAGAAGAICLLISRYNADGDKDTQPLPIPPGSTVDLQHFCTGDGTCVRYGRRDTRLHLLFFMSALPYIVDTTRLPSESFTRLPQPSLGDT